MAKRGRRKKVARKSKAAVRKPVRRAARRAPAAGVKNIVANLTKARRELLAQRTAVDGQIAALDRALAAMGSARPARRVAARPAARRAAGRWPAARRAPRAPRVMRGRRTGSLKDQIAKVLPAGKGPMAVRDITARVLKTGYKTKNKTLAKSVGIALTQMPDVIKIRRGIFRKK